MRTLIKRNFERSKHGGADMIIVFKKDATDAEKRHVYEKIEELGLRHQSIIGEELTVVGVIGQEDAIRTLPLEAMPGVDYAVPILKPFKLASVELKKKKTIVDVDGVKVGGNEVVLMAGPCSVEGHDMLMEIAEDVKRSGAKILRGGAFKPRTSPYSFQGYGREALEYLAEARRATGLKIVTEVMEPNDVELIEEYTDILQVGARNMANYRLLSRVGESSKPVLLKRGFAATVKELLMCAEYILSNGNMNVMLCERGIRSFENGTRNTLDLSAIPAIRHQSHLPVIVDPSHGTGKSEYVAAMSKAAIAAGADGLIVEVHNCPEKALSDGEQSLTPEQFDDLVKEVRPVAHAVGRKM
jgi:3-deoxy-7-phosphoheptulonate synthase